MTCDIQHVGVSEHSLKMLGPCLEGKLFGNIFPKGLLSELLS